MSKVDEEAKIRVEPFLETLDDTQLEMFLDIMNWMADRERIPGEISRLLQ